MSTDSTLQGLMQEVLSTIREIRPDLDPIQMLLLGPKAVDPMLAHWQQLERCVCSAKLAIVRDEFSIRFPNLVSETENFTFGIADQVADRYMTFLKPRETDDIFQMTCVVIEDAFGPDPAKRVPGISHFASNLTQVLQAYSANIEKQFDPFTSVRGVNGGA